MKQTSVVLLLLCLTASGSTRVPEVVWPDITTSLCDGHFSPCLVIGTIATVPPRSEPTTIGIWEDTVSKSPNKPRPHVNLGRAYQKVGRFDDAIREFRAAIAVSSQAPKHEQLSTVQFAATNMAQIFIRFGDLDRAESVLVEAWNKEPGYPGIAANLATVYAERANRLLLEGNKAEWRKKVEFALELLDVGLENVPNYPGFTEVGPLIENRGKILTVLGRCEEAEKMFAAARELPDASELPVCNKSKERGNSN